MHSCSIPVVQSVRGEFTKEGSIVPGHPAELPYPEPSGYLSDGRHTRIRGYERLPNLVECSPVQVLHRRHTEVPEKGITKCSLGYTCRCSELLHG